MALWPIVTIDGPLSGQSQGNGTHYREDWEPVPICGVASQPLYDVGDNAPDAHPAYWLGWRSRRRRGRMDAFLRRPFVGGSLPVVVSPPPLGAHVPNCESSHA
jgi:hypothetical protein